MRSWDEIRARMREELAARLDGRASATNLGLILRKVAALPDDQEAAGRDLGKIRLAVQLFIDEDLADVVHDALRRILAESIER